MDEHDAGARELVLLEEAKFWNEVAICGEAVKRYATISEAADDADVVVVGRFVDVSVGNIVQGDAAEDFYAEANVSVQVQDTIRSRAPSMLSVSLILASVSRESLDRTVEAMRGRLPARPVVLLLEERSDFPDLYVAVGADVGIWTRTLRSALDNPIASDSCLGHYGPDLDGFLEGSQTIEELIAHLRS